MDIDAALSTRLIDLPHHRAGLGTGLMNEERPSWLVHR
jgi:hypothetical protein